MATDSKIQWTDHTFNPWSGCSKVHAGCTNCYAEINYSVKMRGVQWGPNGTRVLTAPATWHEPLKWNRQAQAEGVRKRVFCASLADVFEDWQGPIIDHHGNWLLYYPPRDEIMIERPHPDDFRGDWNQIRVLKLDDLRRRLFDLIDNTPMLDWLLLTKRPENVLRMWPDCSLGVWPAPHNDARRNVWLGTSISDQATADQFIPELLKCRDLAPVLFLSAEPLLGPIRLSPYLDPQSGQVKVAQGVDCDWVIVGGESGHHARPCCLEYIDDLRRQCVSAGVPCFVKQLGAMPVTTNLNLYDYFPEQLKPWGDYVGSGRIVLYDRKGGDWSEWPAELRVREFPKVAWRGVA